jgi:hypothetical protein
MGLVSNVQQVMASAQRPEATQNTDPLTQTGWWSKLTGGETEKKSAVAQIKYQN